MRGCSVLAALALVVAGCTTPPRAPESAVPCGGAEGPTAPWCTERDFPGTLPPATPEAVRVLTADLLAACPPPTGDDPTPGLSTPARWAADHPMRWSPMPSTLRLEVAALERLLADTAAAHPDRVRILDRLAETSARIELLDYRSCRAEVVPAEPGSYQLAQVRDRVRAVVGSLRENREGGRRACALLRHDYPQYNFTVPCPP